MPMWLSRMGSLLLPAGPWRAGEGRGQGTAAGPVGGSPCTLQGSGPVILLFVNVWWEIFPELRYFPVGWGPHLTPQWLPFTKRQSLCKWNLPSQVPQHRLHHALRSGSYFRSASLLSHPLPLVPFLTTPSGNLLETPD